MIPAIIHEQFYIFRDANRTIGFASWAYCNDAVVAKIERGLLEARDHLSVQDWKSGSEIWLVDLVAPFANSANRQREIMIADLASKPLSGSIFHLHTTDPETGRRCARTIPRDTGERLRAALKHTLV